MSGFQLEKFQSAQYESRTEEVLVESLREFFGEDEEPKFVIRGLKAFELQIAIEASTKNKSIDGIVKAITTDRDQVNAIRKAIGLSDDVPGEVAKRIEMLVMGCVSPKLNHAAAVKFSEYFPVEFYDITNKITVLTGLGGSRVKTQPSSPTIAP